ncbi:glutathione-disulfide reductase [Marilutibacter chinensis]|uniref:Glutathione-disulfide reductase n=1 Tax=Marilutibacter chinensis TaxID=2912247 RepID=A0ABS9HW30_9GAMM|nr:glutathione-disulfide reductase [Lysobacter chinensis]MCF7221173.1 glutathione-disulfide reductase [Lysobacter chinensis]MCF7223086.1 glutathione-disulfide reductase [Lysobacter chinensis]
MSSLPRNREVLVSESDANGARAAGEFDLIVIGGGSGGLAGAFRAAEHGARVALMEPSALGGTCVNVGCVPKKAMWLAAEVGRRLAMAGPLGFPVQARALDWPTFIAHRERYIHNIHQSYRRRIDAAGIVHLPRHGRLVERMRSGGGVVECDDGLRLQAQRILIATGGHALRPDIPGAGLGAVSDDFFRWTAAPERIAVVGGGYIAVELAGVLQQLGSRVEMLVRGERLLHGFDAAIAEQLADDYCQAGIRLSLGCPVAELQRDDDGQLRVRDGAGTWHGPYDQVLFATGRGPNTHGLGLPEVGVETDADGHVRVDAGHATSAPGIHAVGDVTADMALTPVAIAAARRLMSHVFGGAADPALDQTNVPTVVFSHPPVGAVGLTEAQARERHGDAAVRVYTTGFRPMLEALTDTPQRSLFKLVCIGEERRVVGLHLLGEAADEILQGFAVALKKGITLQDLHDTIAIHPTSAEEIVLLR